MNRENVRTLITYLEVLARPETRTGLGFNMNSFLADRMHKDESGHGCETTACIAGWAVVAKERYKTVRKIWDAKSGARKGIEKIAQKWLGLKRCEAQKMFYAWDKTLPQAIAMLKHFEHTGEVYWTEEAP